MTEGKYDDSRPPIPADIRRAVEVESGHACAVKKCHEHTYLEIHHIDEDRTNNVLGNLILLCDKHHKMAHKKIIDRKALHQYKGLLSPKGAVSIESLYQLLSELFGEAVATSLAANPQRSIPVVLNPLTIEELQPYINVKLISLFPTGAICSMGANSRVGNHIEELKRPFGLGNGFVLTYGENG
ncbi:MAG TPA: hypothetical protein DEQ20_11785 [Desulfobulbaceae bacterium]|nr:MAG: hypothetical protein A2520_02985 [Deltaproteobacteria bacterium RIFOXYD12_FULL_53_23]HCC55577.1 hypothetical protein [Desulfobulbaceae bacterium]